MTKTNPILYLAAGLALGVGASYLFWSSNDQQGVQPESSESASSTKLESVAREMAALVEQLESSSRKIDAEQASVRQPIPSAVEASIPKLLSAVEERLRVLKSTLEQLPVGAAQRFRLADAPERAVAVPLIRKAVLDYQADKHAYVKSVSLLPMGEVLRRFGHPDLVHPSGWEWYVKEEGDQPYYSIKVKFSVGRVSSIVCRMGPR